MPEQPQWSERTLDMPPQDPWADAPTTPTQGSPPPTAPFPAAAPEPEPRAPFSQGRAQVNARPQPPYAEHEPTGTGWPGAGAPGGHHPSISWKWSELRLGGEWTSAAVLFAFVCWGIWAISTDGNLTGPVIIFACSLLVAGGLFALCRFVGHLVLEKQFGRTRRSAKGSHVITAVFLFGVGVAHLRQTDWVMEAYRWVLGLF
jgi:hypothetical protein